MNKQMMWWVLIVVALLLGAFGGFSYEKSKLTSQMMMNDALQKQLNDANMKNNQLMKMQQTVTPTGAMMQH